MIVTGRYYNGADHGDDILVMKFSGDDGHLLWLKTFDGPAHLDDRGWNLVLGADDDAYVTGVVQTSAEAAAFFTARLRGSDGGATWQVTLPGAVNNLDDRCGWLTLVPGGDVVLVSKTWSASLSYEVLLHRYAAATGGQVWHRLQGSAGAVADEARAALRLSSGDIAVAGTRNGDYMVLRIRAADGTAAWSAGYDGPPGWYDSAECLAEGPAGEVIAGGYSTAAATGWDAVCAAFGPADGAPLWSLRFDAGDALTDAVSVLASGPLGDLFVAGYGYLNATYSDLLTVRYFAGSPTAGVEPAGRARPILSAVPNPARHGTQLRLVLPRPETVRVVVYDPSGRVRAHLAGGTRPAGPLRIDWNGTDDEGHLLPPGIYLARVEGRTVSAETKVVWLP